MIHLCDVNVFLAVAVGQHASHETAAAWFRGLPEKAQAGFCRATQISFLRLLTQKISEHFIPLTNRDAWKAYDRLCRDDAVVFLEEPPGLEPVWRKLAHPARVSPKLWMNAYLAAFAIAGGFRMATLDGGFKRFEPHGLELLALQT